MKVTGCWHSAPDIDRLKDRGDGPLASSLSVSLSVSRRNGAGLPSARQSTVTAVLLEWIAIATGSRSGREHGVECRSHPWLAYANFIQPFC